MNLIPLKQIKNGLKKVKKTNKISINMVGNHSKEQYRNNYGIIKSALLNINSIYHTCDMITKLRIYKLYQQLFYYVSKSFYNIDDPDIDSVYTICQRIFYLYYNFCI